MDLFGDFGECSWRLECSKNTSTPDATRWTLRRSRILWTGQGVLTNLYGASGASFRAVNGLSASTWLDLGVTVRLVSPQPTTIRDLQPGHPFQEGPGTMSWAVRF